MKLDRIEIGRRRIDEKIKNKGFVFEMHPKPDSELVTFRLTDPVSGNVARINLNKHKLTKAQVASVKEQLYTRAITGVW